MSLADKARKSTLFVVPGQLMTRVLGFGYLVLLARGLSVHDYGVYNFVTGTLIVLSYLCNFGVASSLQRFLPEYEQRDQQGTSLRTILYAHGFRLTLSLLVLGVAVALFDVWAPCFHMEDRSIEFSIFAIGSFFLFQVEYLEVELEALFMHPVTSSVRVLYTLVKVGAAYLAMRAGLSVGGVLTAEAASSIAGFLALGWAFFTRVFQPRWRKLGPEESVEFRRIGRYSGINALVIPGGILYSHSMDYFVIAAMANPYELGLYALASRVSRTLISIMPHNMLQGVIRPAFYGSFCSARDRNAELNQMFQMVVNMEAAFLVPALSLASVAATDLITAVFDPKYVEATPVMLIFLFFNAFLILDLPSDLVLQAIERVEARLYGQVFALYNIAGAIVLMGVFGVAGVAFATGSAQAMKALYYYAMARRHADIRMNLLPLLRIAVNSAVASAAAVLVPAMRSPLLHLIVTLSVGATAYTAMSFLNNFMGTAEKRLFNSMCKREVFSV